MRFLASSSVLLLIALFLAAAPRASAPPPPPPDDSPKPSPTYFHLGGGFGPDHGKHLWDSKHPYRGGDHADHLGPEVSTWELDHLIMSTEHLSTTLFVLFYSPSERDSKRVLDNWAEVQTQFQDLSSVGVLQVDCVGKGKEACQDHGVKRLPSFQVFRPGVPAGEFFRLPPLTSRIHDTTWALETWVRAALAPEHVRPREVAAIAGCVAFRQTGACDPSGERETHLDRHCEATVGSDASGFCECAPGDHRSYVGCGHVPFSCHDVCVSVPGCTSWRQTGECHPDGPREPQGDLHCRSRVPKGASGFCECESGREVARVGCESKGLFTCEERCSEPAKA